MADSNNGTKKCPQRQEEIAASAKRCPKCQADLRPWPVKHPILMVLAIVFGLIIIGAIMSPSEVQKEQAFDKEEAIVMSSVELSNEYNDNNAAFYAKYTNKKIEMTGSIDHIGESFITFDGNLGDRIDCHPSDMSSFLNFRKGEQSSRKQGSHA